MTKKIANYHLPISNLLKDIQCQSMLTFESRTTILMMKIDGENLSGLNLNCTDFINSEISDSTFYNCDLRGASFRDSHIQRVKFINCSICDMELPENISSITFHNCSDLPSGLQRLVNLENPISVKDYPATIYGKMLSLIEVITKVVTSLSTEKLL